MTCRIAWKAIVFSIALAAATVPGAARADRGAPADTAATTAASRDRNARADRAAPPDTSTAARPAGESATAASPDSAAFTSLTYSLLPDHRWLASPTITVMSSSFPEQAERLLGWERYRATPEECAVTGASLGLSLGGAAGALGMMAGAWGEDETLAIAGAAAALGAIYGGLFKADDPEWNLRIRLRPERKR